MLVKKKSCYKMHCILHTRGPLGTEIVSKVQLTVDLVHRLLLGHDIIFFF